ncbi:HAMP domain-containing sensor histidine kinase [uncultured Campylobacter sp.]|uniref:sensor histidine kinase n=1 Tax=uncultured Campylobacter sp. TaxID=218934 RepID=UPI002620DB25|nr:HAMP domain-containing sensor histidine kinase [uncultured Campylobacter sp.]
MSEKSALTLKILSLYLISSALFLGYFFKINYSMNEAALLSHRIKELKEIKMMIYMKASMDGLESLADFEREKGVSACIFKPNSDEIYGCSGELGALDKAKLKAEFISGGRLGIYENLQNMEERNAFSKAKIILLGSSVQGEILTLRIKTAAMMIALLGVILAVAFYLVRLGTKPLYDKIDTLNRFIKDSTHEINTPLSIISMSVETMRHAELGEYNAKRVANIDLAAKTLSRIYEDLVFLTFGMKKEGEISSIDLKSLVASRCEYFAPFIQKRKLSLKTDLSDASMNANIYEISRLIDNLLSNAVKYANAGGYVDVRLRRGELAISNSGEGIDRKKGGEIFRRFARFNSSEGGFGIGLSIVSEVCKKYSFSISYDSVPGEITTFRLTWRE